jgi:hypothetical protein
VAALHAHVLGHHHDAAVAAHGAIIARLMPGVAAGRLDDRGAGTQLSFALRREDHAEGRAVLDAAAGVPGLELA